MQSYRERRDKTAVLSCPRGENATFDRRDVVTVLGRLVGLDKVSTVGQLEGNRWEVVLTDGNALKKLTDMIAIDIKGAVVDISVFRRQPRRLRVMRVPMCIPDEVVVDALRRYSVKTLSINYERDPVDGITTNTRAMMVDTNDWDAIPDTLAWSFDGFRGTALLFLVGRPPRCHRCQQRGHKVADCTQPYCRVCRRAGHDTSGECYRYRTSYAGRAAVATRVAEAETEVHEAPMESAEVVETTETVTQPATASAEQSELQTAAGASWSAAIGRR